jgi:hypothetical protein
MTKGKLKFSQESRRWQICDEQGERLWEITSGEVIHVKVADQWIVTRIECGANGYYPVQRGVALYDGQQVEVNR